MLLPDPLQNEPMEFVSPQKRKDDLSRQFCLFAREQILEKKRPLLGKEILEALKESIPELYEEVKKKCLDYPRIILSQSKLVFVKFKRVEPQPGVDKRSLYYGVDAETYSNEWIPVQVNKPPQSQNNLADADMKQLNDYSLTSVLPGITFGSKFQSNNDEIPGSKEWKTLIDSVDQNDPLWNNLLDIIAIIDREVLSGKDHTHLIKDLMNGNLILLESVNAPVIEKILQHEIDYRLKLISK